jgi:hypothetical protein
MDLTRPVPCSAQPSDKARHGPHRYLRVHVAALVERRRPRLTAHRCGKENWIRSRTSDGRAEVSVFVVGVAPSVEVDVELDEFDGAIGRELSED